MRRNYAPEPTMRHVDQTDRPRCQEWVVRYRGLADYSGQCERPAKKGSCFCAIHAPDAKAKRAKATNEKWAAKCLKWKDESFGKRFREALELIEAGHNDPRSVAREVLELWRK